MEKFRTSLLAFFGLITIEPLMFLHQLSFDLHATIDQSLLMDKVCLTGSQWIGNGSTYPEEVCNSLDNGENEEIQEYVQVTSNNIRATKSYIEVLPTLLFIAFGGAWSDKYGRKWILLLPYIGQTMLNITALMYTIFWYEIRADWVIVGAIFDVCGGMPAFMMASYSYMVDVSKGENRVVRIGFLDLGYFFGRIVGADLSGVMYRAFGYVGNYSLALFFDAIGLLYLIFVVKESRVTSTSNRSTEKEGKLAKVTNLLKDLGGSLTKRRADGLRHIMWLCLLSFFIQLICANDREIDVSYVKRRFEWSTEEKFNVWWSKFKANIAWFSIAGILLAPLLNRLVRKNDIVLCLISIVSNSTIPLTFLIATKPEILYLGYALGVFSPLLTISIRSTLSKLVAVDESGKVQSMCGIFSTFGIVIRPMYDFIYNATINWHLGFVYCLVLVLFAVAFLIFLYVYLYLRSIKWSGYYGRNEENQKRIPG